MRYMFLLYSQENESATLEEKQAVSAAHQALREEASRRGLFRAADPLASASTATTVRVQGSEVFLTDGPFLETKEQLAGYYILDCQNLDEAIEWAARMPTTWSGPPGFVEIRPLLDLSGLHVDG